MLALLLSNQLISLKAFLEKNVIFGMRISSLSFSLLLFADTYAKHEVHFNWDYDRRGPIHLPGHGISLAEYSINRIDTQRCDIHRKSGECWKIFF